MTVADSTVTYDGTTQAVSASATGGGSALTVDVTYAGLKSSPYFDRVKMVCPKGAGGLFTVALKGGYDSCIKFVNALEIFSHVSNLGDSRSLVIHTASTTHRQLTEEQQVAAGSAPNVVRISIGIEDPDDLIADLKQALSAAK